MATEYSPHSGGSFLKVLSISPIRYEIAIQVHYIPNENKYLKFMLHLLPLQVRNTLSYPTNKCSQLRPSLQQFISTFTQCNYHSTSATLYRRLETKWIRIILVPKVNDYCRLVITIEPGALTRPQRNGR